ncbi:PREDICTED: G-box-binding factor-like [Ceratosolen solmsi marchali]|uniref:G-box-binding factor-like n=1 Tax=Ceratosolen solmsi marchali TaxID=326594 RepID=A0AAJ6YJQ6_9HYME|nr:PREDICTED: G-box-binding factor-like [Ceratosolen solmsi marchali]
MVIPSSDHSIPKLYQVENMKIFLLTVVILAFSHGAPNYKTKRDILPGDPRFGTDYHHQHHRLQPLSIDVNHFSQYLPPSAQFDNVEETKQNLELPSTSYGVPFRQEHQVSTQVSTPNNKYLSYGTPSFNHGDIAPQLHHVEHQFVNQVPATLVQAQSNIATPVAVPHTTYGVQHQQQQVHSLQHEMQLNNEQVQHFQHHSEQIHQPASFYGAPVSQQQHYTNAQLVHQFGPTEVQSSQQEQHHQQIQQVHQVHQPMTVHGFPVPQQHEHVQAVQQFTPIVAQSNQQQHYEQFQHIPHQAQQSQQPSLIYGNPLQGNQQQVSHAHSASIDNEKLVFEAPIQSIEVSQSHLVENIPTPSSSVNVDNDTVTISAVEAKESVFGGYKYTQPTSSNGGYVY